MTIGRKILGGYAVVLTLLLVVAGMALHSLSTVSATYEGFLDRNVRAVVAAERLAQEVRNQVALYRGALLYPAEQARMIAELREGDAGIDRLISEVQALTTAEEGKAIADRIESANAQLRARQAEAIRLVEHGQREDAIALGPVMVPLSAALRAACAEFITFRQEQLAAGRARAEKDIADTRRDVLAVSLLAVLAAIVLGIFATRAVTLPLRETIAQLSASSAEILATTSQVAAGAAQTATSISETTATVEEVKQTAQLSTAPSASPVSPSRAARAWRGRSRGCTASRIRWSRSRARSSACPSRVNRSARSSQR
jgi:CHASE3 domain sensor protein